MLYADAAYAAAYMTARPQGEAWAALGADRQARLLVAASDNLTLYAQELGGWAQGWTQESLPDAIRAACCVEAMALADEAASVRRGLIAQGVTSTSIGGASESYGAAMAQDSRTASPMAARMIRPYLRHTGRMADIR